MTDFSASLVAETEGKVERKIAVVELLLGRKSGSSI